MIARARPPAVETADDVRSALPAGLVVTISRYLAGSGGSSPAARVAHDVVRTATVRTSVVAVRAGELRRVDVWSGTGSDGAIVAAGFHPDPDRRPRAIVAPSCRAEELMASLTSRLLGALPPPAPNGFATPDPLRCDVTGLPAELGHVLAARRRAPDAGTLAIAAGESGLAVSTDGTGDHPWSWRPVTPQTAIRLLADLVAPAHRDADPDQSGQGRPSSSSRVDPGPMPSSASRPCSTSTATTKSGAVG